jgi:hypothetical protein
VAILAGPGVAPAAAQTDAAQVRDLVEPRLIPPDVVSYQAMQYLMDRVPPFDVPTTREGWETEARKIRGHLTELILEGWPKDHLDADPGFTETGVIADPGTGYRIRKLRYEIVPGFYGAALLYEPDDLRGQVPAVLNVNGHGWNKAIEWKQKRCINQAKRGMLALNLEWIYYGELEHPENKHWFGPHLDLVGTNGMGLFYLAMQRGLDYLDRHPNVDRRRIGMTGLSGGGWQTIVLSALDERVAAAVPVAGFSGFESRIERGGGGDIGDFEQKGSDFVARYDYPHLVALLAPRAALLVHNADDIFRSHLVKPRIFDDVRPVWQLYGAADRFAFHENLDPGDHNYALENRLEAYRFFARAFDQPAVEDELPVGGELKTAEELTVGLPEENLTILGLARRLGERIDRGPIPDVGPARRRWAEDARQELHRLVRPPRVVVERAWTLYGTRLQGLETRSYRFDCSNGLSAAGVWLHAMWGRRAPAGVTIVLHDDGRAAAAQRISDQVNRGEPVLALDLLFTGDAAIDGRGPERTIQAFAGLGDRPLGLRAAQLLAVARWVQSTSGAEHVRLDATGMRSQAVALVAAALGPEVFSEVSVQDGMSSLQHVLDAPVMHADAPELFCFDLYRQFDLDRLEAMADIPIRTTVVKK